MALGDGLVLEYGQEVGGRGDLRGGDASAEASEDAFEIMSETQGRSVASSQSMRERAKDSNEAS
jgi:hypothetical protein